MGQTKGLGVPSGKNAVTGIKLGTGKAGGALAPSGSKALYPAGRATHPHVASMSSIPVSKPKAGKKPNALRHPPTF